MFQRTSLRLAGMYLAIIMAISLFFSVSLYQLSVQELGRGLRRPPQVVVRSPDNRSFIINGDELAKALEQQFQEAKHRVIQRLVLTNLIILLAGGITSYILAVKSLEPIEKAHRSLERFSADASHELRTPITAMKTEIEVALMDKNLDKRAAKKLLHSNIEELDKLTKLSTGLLELTQLTNETLEKGNTSLKKLVADAIKQVSPTAEKKNIRVINKVDAKTSVMVSEDRMCEVIVVLLDNAVKYSQKDSKVTVTNRQDKRSQLISITDTGIGIAPQDLPHIFERFYRSDKARSKVSGNGYGIGLALASEIVSLHSGSITATSKEGEGSTFTVHLPA